MRALTLQSLEALGGAQEIVRTHLDGALRNFSREERYVVADLFHQLVTPSGTKIAHSAEDLAEYVALPVASVALLLEKLAAPDTRIVRAVAPPPGDAGPSRYEIFHDVLAPSILDWRSRQSESRRARAQLRRRVIRLLAVLGAAVIALIIWLGIAAINARNQADASAARARSAQRHAELVSRQNASLATKFGAKSRQNARLARKNAGLAATYNQQRLVARLLKRRADQNAVAARGLAAQASRLAAVNAVQAAKQRSLATLALQSARAAELSLTIAKESAALGSVSPVIGICSWDAGGASFTQMEIDHVPPNAVVTAELPGTSYGRLTITNRGQIGKVAFPKFVTMGGCFEGDPSQVPNLVFAAFGQKLSISVKLTDLAWQYEAKITSIPSTAPPQSGGGPPTAGFKLIQQSTCRRPGSRARASQVPLVCRPLP